MFSLLKKLFHRKWQTIDNGLTFSAFDNTPKTFEIYQKRIEKGKFIAVESSVKIDELTFANQEQANEFCKLINPSTYAIAKW